MGKKKGTILSVIKISTILIVAIFLAFIAAKHLFDKPELSDMNSKDKNMLLSALIDFPDDARTLYSESTMYEMVARCKEAGVSRLYMQYYGNRDYGYFWDHNAPSHRGIAATGKNLPEYSRIFVEAAKANGIEPVAVMRPLEQGIWLTYSPYYKEARENPGIEYTGGKIMIASKFLLKNPELRIKRRSWDLDPDAVNKEIYSIKLYKQNNIHSRIKKQDITIYISPNNANYQKYEGDFTLTYKTQLAKKDVIVSQFAVNYPLTTLTQKGDEIEVIELSGLAINERFVVVSAQCTDSIGVETLFTNTPMNAISIHEKDGTKISASPGSAIRPTPTKDPHLEAGFNYDDGFGESWTATLDPNGKAGFLAICKGKNQYAHGALCVCEPKVQEYWLKWLEKALDDGYEMIGNRIECHSMHVDDPLAYGYNDCIKEEYFKRHGQCSEEEMELAKIATIRGDAYTELFIEGAKRVRARGKKVYLTLNVEMLMDPIPLARHMAYPLNVEWQWERWLEEIKPDEINIRSYQISTEFILNDPQCQNFIKTAETYGVPMTMERYCYWDFPADFEMVRETGIFSRMTLYEVNNLIESDGKGGIIEVKPELLKKLETLTQEK